MLTHPKIPIDTEKVISQVLREKKTNVTTV